MSEMRSVEDYFGELIELETAELRAEYLVQVAGDDAELRRQLEKLLDAHLKAGSFLREAESTDATQGFDDTKYVGTTIGPYKLLQKIGEGGMGVVFMAEQKSPVKRHVALKIIKPGMDSRQVIARFEAERQALAMMDHPNIARVLEAGATDDRRPYFVMELVKGTPITEYCDTHCLSTRARLSLFADVCQAVQHAHQKGIIHRDLKPSNVLVASFDDRPMVKVIDFGVAKATNQELTEQTLFTQFGQVVGTVEYMSPEQARFNQLDIDTRSDIYSLGVLLYELLTGEPPFDRRRLRTAALDEVMKIIREEQPPRPSTRLSTLGAGAKSVSEKRGTDLVGLGRTIRGDIDLIVMKALEKDRARRYETANEFSVDVRRYLAGEAILARPASAIYRLRRFTARNKGLVAGAASVFAAITIGLATSIYFLLAFQNEAIQARQARDRAAEILRDHQQVVKEQVVLEILSGDYAEADQLLSDAQTWNLSSEWTLTVEGLVDVLRGQSDDAVTKLEALGDWIHSDTAAFALSAIAYGWAGNEDEQFERIAKLRNMPAETFEEHLAVGIALGRWLPHEGIEHLEQAHKQRRFSPVARLWLEDARCWLASTLDNPDDAIRCAQQATKNIEALKLLLRDEPSAVGIYIHARMTTAHALNRAGQFSEAKAEMLQVEEYVELLNQSPENDSAAWWPAMVGLMAGDYESVLQKFESGALNQASMNNYVIQYLAAECFRTGQFSRGTRLQSKLHGRFRDDTASVRWYLELALPSAAANRAEISRKLQTQLVARTSSSSDFFLIFDWTAFKMLGDRERSKAIGQELYDSAFLRGLFPGEIACADYMRGHQVDPTVLLELCRESQIFTAYAHWVIAFEMLSRGDRLSAEPHFAAIGQSGDFQHGVFWWGKAFHAKVLDPSWLPWLNLNAR